MFAFCLVLMACNGLLVIHAALRSVHDEETVEEHLSGYYYLGMKVNPSCDRKEAVISAPLRSRLCVSSLPG